MRVQYKHHYSVSCVEPMGAEWENPARKNQKKKKKKKKEQNLKQPSRVMRCRGVSRVKSSLARREVCAACGSSSCMHVAHCVQSAVGTGESLRRWYWMLAEVMVATNSDEGRTYVGFSVD